MKKNPSYIILSYFTIYTNYKISIYICKCICRI
nr:MAG TPA: hypothetical protein [Caudoviricetes sp.]